MQHLQIPHTEIFIHPKKHKIKTMKKYSLFLLFCLLLSIEAMADVVGTWKTYKSYTEIEQIEPSNKEVYVLSSGSLYSFNPTDNSIQTYDRTNSLNSNEITHIAWSQKARKLLITYADYNIDLLTSSGETTFINDYANKQISGDKTINSIYIFDRFAFLSTGFGVIKIDVEKEYIVDTYNLGYAVDYCYVEGQYLFAASEEKGIRKGLMTANLLDKKNWTFHTAFSPLEKGQYTYDTYRKCYWAPDSQGKLSQYSFADGTYTQTMTGVCPDGPSTNHCWRLYWHDNRLFIAAGNFSYNCYYYYPGCVTTFDGENWSTIESPQEDILGYKYQDANCIAFDPSDKNHYYVGSMSGILEFRDGKFLEAYHYDNSTVSGRYDQKNKENQLICSMTFDNEKNLWAMNGWNNVPIICRKADGTWTEYPHENNRIDNLYGVDLQSIFVSPTNGYMWFTNNCAKNSAIFRYDYKNDILEDCKEFYNQDGTKLAISFAYYLKEDKKGNIWVATDVGPMQITRESINKGEFTFTQHKVPRNDGTNYADYLLNNVSCRCIAIDGANRKWIGTTGTGVFLISDDNNTQEEHFTAENSPLLSNHVYDIAIDPNTGIVYFATDKGLCSYQAENTTTNEDMTDANVSVYPNPVTPEYTGMINITGLSMNSDVKIVSSAGALVNEGTSRGGSYSWNGCDMDGEKVASGVYMIQVAKEDGSKGIVAKVAIIR